MEISLSEIQIIPIKPRNGLLAFCSFVINDSFFVGDIAIYSRLNGGYRLCYPLKILHNGAKIQCFHPITKESAQAIEEPIINAFENLMKKSRESEVVYDTRDYQ